MFENNILLIGKKINEGIQMLGTGFVVSNKFEIVTSRHVVGDNDEGLVAILPNMTDINSYQDTTDSKCIYVSIKIVAADPFRDITILKGDGYYNNKLLDIGGFDSVDVGDKVEIIGYPHCVEGRRVLTYQTAIIGAKVLLESQGIKSKYAVINTQTRPGQSGSIIINSKRTEVVGMLVGAFAPDIQSISLGGINPRELHQTTHCISAEYIKRMI